ncbi:MAG: cytochrome c biogenesis protein CcdA [bacterium]
MTELADGLQGYLSAASPFAIGAAFFGGVLASFTPCVYPLIPVTAAYIGGRGAGTTPWRGFVLSLLYVLGVAVTYSALGAAAALTGRLFGSAAASPWALFLVANVCVLMGLNMLEVFELPLPGFLRGADPVKKRGTFAAAFAVGLLAGLVASPCTAPVLLVLLAFVAERRNLVFGVSALFAFALGMGLLLIVVGTSSAALASLPKSGGWTVKVKKTFGWALIAIGEYFLVRTGALLV